MRSQNPATKSIETTTIDVKTGKSTTAKTAVSTITHKTDVQATTAIQQNIDPKITQQKTTEISSTPIKTVTPLSKDTVQAVAHKVVHVKAKPVVIEDTVVKVIRKARTKRE